MTSKIFKIEGYNVLAFEPTVINPELKIAGAVLSGVEKKSANKALTEIIIPDLAKMGLFPENISFDYFAAHSHELPELIANKISQAMPENERFFLNVEDYSKSGIPRNLQAFDEMYNRIKGKGIQAVLLNTPLPRIMTPIPENTREEIEKIEKFNADVKRSKEEYITLAQKLKDREYPGLERATFIATMSIREPMPAQLLEEMNRREKTNCRGRREMARLFGSSYLSPIGESMVGITTNDCTNFIYDRLKYIREMGNLAYPTPDSNKPGAKNGTSTRFKKF